MSTQPKELKAGRYVLLRTLGEGAQGETYEAIDQHGERPESAPLADRWARYVRHARAGGAPAHASALVAIKCFRVGKAKAWKEVELAEREARTLASLEHPHLPKYVDHFEEGGALYLVMEKIEGESVAALRERGHTFSVSEVRRMLEDIGSALSYLHARAPAVVHRDVKPGNVVRRPDGSFVLVDFGSVRDRLERGGSTVVGTFGYMAPEQFQGRASPKSDVYGLGATAMTMLTGREPEELPHEGLGIDVRRALPSSTPAPLARALASMLVPDPDRRARSVEEALALVRTTESSVERASQRVQRAHVAREQASPRRALARRPRVPLVARFFAQLGLFIAILAVSVTVGAAVPMLLFALSFLFGDALRRAARACVRASRRSRAAMLRASARISGARPEELRRIRVASHADRMRVQAELGSSQDEADADAWEDLHVAEGVLEHLEERDQVDERAERARAVLRRR